jgi:hypothetical protein
LYDLCKPCKTKLNNHLRNLDQRIGNSYVRQRVPTVATHVNNVHSITSSANALKTKSNENRLINSNNNDYETNHKHNKNGVLKELNNFNLSENLKSTVKKAYTIAGTVPSYVFKNTPSPIKKSTESRIRARNPLHREQPAVETQLPVHLITEETYDQDMDYQENSYSHQIDSQQDYRKFNGSCNQNNSNCSLNVSQKSATPTKKNQKTISTTNENTRKFSCKSLSLVCEDFLLFLFVVLVFACDLVNLVNDSGVLSNNQNTNHEWFQTLLDLYRQIIFLLVCVNLLSMHLAYKRPKLSRFLITCGFIFNLVLHFHVFDFKTEEQYITECFISFFLTSYLSIARVYNIFQLVRYM